MEKLKTLNTKHGTILFNFMKRIDKFIYEITETTQMMNVFSKFAPLREQAKRLHNALGKDVKVERDKNIEWIFMFPNFMLFATMGFATALKDKENQNEIDEMCEELFFIMQDTITDLDEMVDDYCTEKEANELINKIKKTTNKNKNKND